MPGFAFETPFSPPQDYRAEGFFAIDASDAVEAGGDRRRIPHDRLRSLGDYLADRFLACHVGSRNVYYDAEREVMVIVRPDGTVAAELIRAERRVLTKVQRL